MTNITTLIINSKKISGKIEFGIPNSSYEMDEMFKLRYEVYSKKDYIDHNQYQNGREIDDYDISGKSKYFIAKYNGKIIGSIRMIIDHPLPTQKAFTFDEPGSIKAIKIKNRCEFGRFVIVKPNENYYFPRGLVMLFMINKLNQFALENKYYGGYAFVKKSLLIKMNKLNFPIHTINMHTLIYTSGVLKKYFSQKNDPVIPIYFLSNEFKKYLDKRINNFFLFKKTSDNVFILRNFPYYILLKIKGLI